LATLRRFADRMYWLFDTPKDFHQASCRRAAIVGRDLRKLNSRSLDPLR